MPVYALWTIVIEYWNNNYDSAIVVYEHYTNIYYNGGDKEWYFTLKTVN